MQKYAKTIGSVFSAFACFFCVAHAAEAMDVYGEWMPPNMDAVISIQDCGDVLCAELVGHNYTALTQQDINNPDPALRSRALVGVKILDRLRMAGRLKWSGGELYDPRTGNYYRSRVQVLDSTTLKITGCVGLGLCKGYIWTRAGF